MKLVQKENRQLRIEDCRLPEFLAKGYAEVTPDKTERLPDKTERLPEKHAAQRKKGKVS